MKSIFKLPILEDPQTLDPQKCGDRISSALIFLLFRGLTRLEPDRNIKTDLADSYHISADGTTYVFHLGDHVWSDGTPITAEDFVFSWRRALDPSFACPFVHFFFPIKNGEKIHHGHLSPKSLGVFAQDPKTLVVELESFCPYFLEITSFYTLFPISSKNPHAWSGSMELSSWESGKKIVVKKNLKTRPPFSTRLDEIHFTFVKDHQEAFSLFEKGAFDWIGEPLVSFPDAFSASLKKNIHPVTGSLACWFNTLKPPFKDRATRKAFFYAIPYQHLHHDLTFPSSSFVPEFLSQPQKTQSLAQPIDREKLITAAQKKLQHETHHSLTLGFEMTEEYLKIAALLKREWEAVFPIHISLIALPFKKFYEMLPERPFDMVLFSSFSLYLDPMNFFERLERKDRPKNLSGWESEKYKKILEKYRKCQKEEKKKELEGRALSILAQELPLLPIYSYHYSYLQKDYVKNFVISPIGAVYFDRVVLSRK